MKRTGYTRVGAMQGGVSLRFVTDNVAPGHLSFSLEITKRLRSSYQAYGRANIAICMAYT